MGKHAETFSGNAAIVKLEIHTQAFHKRFLTIVSKALFESLEYPMNILIFKCVQIIKLTFLARI